MYAYASLEQLVDNLKNEQEEDDFIFNNPVVYPLPISDNKQTKSTKEVSEMFEVYGGPYND